MTIGCGPPELYGTHGKEILCSCMNSDRSLLCLLFSHLESKLYNDTHELIDQGNKTFEISIYLLVNGVLKVGSLIFHCSDKLLNEGRHIKILMNASGDKIFLYISDEAIIFEMNWDLISTGSAVRLSDVLEYDWTTDECPMTPYKVRVRIMKRFRLCATSVCIVDEWPVPAQSSVLVCTRNGVAHRISWNGDFLLSWSLSGIHSVYRTSQVMVSTLSENSCWGSGDTPPPPPPRPPLPPREANSNSSSEEKASIEEEDEEEGSVDKEKDPSQQSNAPRRSASIVTQSSWSCHTRLVAMVFEDGSLSLTQLLTNGPSPGLASVSTSPSPVTVSHTAATKGHICLSGNRLHPILPSDSQRQHFEEAGAVSSSGPSPWKVDVVSRFLAAAFLDTSLSPGETVCGLQRSVMLGTFVGDSCTLLATIVATPLPQDTKTSAHAATLSPPPSRRCGSVSLLILRASLASPMGPAWGGALGRRVALECGCALQVAEAGDISSLPDSPQRTDMQWLQSPSGPVLVLGLGFTVRVLSVSASGMGCMILSKIQISPLLSSIGSTEATLSSPRTSDVWLDLHAGAKQLLVVVSSSSATIDIPAVAKPPSYLCLIPWLHSARSSLSPNASPILVQVTNVTNAVSLLVYDAHESRCSWHRPSPSSPVQSDLSDREGDAGEAPCIESDSGTGGFTRILLPEKFLGQLRHEASVWSRLMSATQQAESSVSRWGDFLPFVPRGLGVLVAASGRFLVCVSTGVPISPPSQGKNGEVGERVESPVIWVLDRQGPGRWRAMDLPETTSVAEIQLWKDGHSVDSLIRNSGTGNVASTSHTPQDTKPNGEKRVVDDKSMPLPAPQKGSLSSKTNAKIKSKSGTWGLLGNCVARPVYLEAARKQATTATGAEIGIDSVSCGHVRMITGLALFDSHSVFLLTLRSLCQDPDSDSRDDENDRNRWRCLLEIASRDPSRKTEEKQGRNGKRQLLSYPSKHRAFLLPSRVTPRYFDVVCIPETTTTHSSVRSPAAGINPSIGRKGVPGNDLRQIPVTQIPSHKPAADAAPNNITTPLVNSDDHISNSSCAVLIGDGWRHFCCYCVTASLLSVASPTLQTHLVPVDYQSFLMWSIDLHSLFGPRVSMDLSYPMRQALLLPIIKGGVAQHEVSVVSDLPGKTSSLDGLALALLDGVGNVIVLDIQPVKDGDAEDIADGTVANVGPSRNINSTRQLEVRIDCIAEGCMQFERIGTASSLPSVLQHALLLYPDGDAEAAAITSGLGFAASIYFPSLRELGLINGPGLHESTSTFSPFGSLEGALALQLQCRDLILPEDAHPLKSKIRGTSGTSSVHASDLTVHFVDGLIEAMSSSDMAEFRQLQSNSKTSSLLRALLQGVRKKPLLCEKLVRGLEARWRGPAELSREQCTQSNYATTSSALFTVDEQILLEILSRLARKLEPHASQHLFPLPSVDKAQVSSSPNNSKSQPGNNEIQSNDLSDTTFEQPSNHHQLFSSSDSPWNQLALYELCLSAGQYHHASRMLTLACDSIGGSSSLASILSSLVLSLELLLLCTKSLSLVIASECLEFCVRLERLAATIEASDHDSEHRPNSIAWSSTQGSSDHASDREDSDDFQDGDWTDGLLASLGSVVSMFTWAEPLTKNATNLFCSTSTTSVLRFFPKNSSRNWVAAACVEAHLGLDALSYLFQSRDAPHIKGEISTSESTIGMLSVTAVSLACSELMNLKRFYAVAAITHNLFSNKNATLALLNGLAIALKKQRINPFPNHPTIPESIPLEQRLSDIVRSFRLQRASLSQLLSPAKKHSSRLPILLKPFSSTVLRQLCEQEIQHIRLRRSSHTVPQSSPKPIPTGASHPTPSDHGHNPHVGLGSISWASSESLSQSKLSIRTDDQTGVEATIGTIPQFEVNETLFFSAPVSESSADYGKPADTPVTLDSLIRSFAAACILMGDKRTACFLFLVLNRLDLAAACLSVTDDAMKARSLARNMQLFAVGQDVELSAEELADAGSIVALHDVINNQLDNTVADFVPKFAILLQSLT